jgi:hypothetical protein
VVHIGGPRHLWPTVITSHVSQRSSGDPGADALDHVVTAAGTTVRDPAVAEDARQAARSLG